MVVTVGGTSSRTAVPPKHISLPINPPVIVSADKTFHNWPAGIESHIKQIGSKCAAYKWLHEKSWKRYKFLHLFLGFCHITLVSLTSVLNVLTILIPMIRPEVITAVLLFTSIFISLSQQFLKYEELAEKHRTAAAHYSGLYYNILRQFSAQSIDRDGALSYFKWLIKEYDNTYSSSPPVSDKIIKLFRKKYKRDPDIEKGLEVEDATITEEGTGTGTSVIPREAPPTPLRKEDERFNYELDRFMQEGFQIR